ncbi:MAG: hypothetical protein M4579_000290 [Chaenotheca gracillima]|nr:MAG: hypothetical protein M4579_000290 [Chaenotheca gracillima]
MVEPMTNHTWSLHVTRNAVLFILSLLFLPVDTAILSISYVIGALSSHSQARRRIRASPSFYPKTILVTGVGMSKGLHLARTFYEAGHQVIGADFEPHGIPVSGRFSRALQRFYTLTKPNANDGAALYIRDLISIVRKEKVDLWVSCSGVASAAEDGQAKEEIEHRTLCKAVQFDTQLTTTLHEKHTFIQNTAALGLNTPETHHVTSRASAHKILHNADAKHYIMKNVGVDDASRGDMTLLPRPTTSETYHHLSAMNISKENPWVLQQYIRGEEYCTHALIIRGEVRAFVACPSSELLMHYEALPPQTALSQAMLQYTQDYAAGTGENMTGHFSIDFLVEESVRGPGTEKVLYPIECNPRAHTAVVLFRGVSHSMAQAYLSVLGSDDAGLTNGTLHDVVTPIDPLRFYWSGHDLLMLLIVPLLSFLSLSASIWDVAESYAKFLERLLFWKDGTFEMWDPLPWWSLYHIYWPGQFLAAIIQERPWSRINVSTTKMFLC